jgi:hypothetical protein
LQSALQEPAQAPVQVLAIWQVKLQLPPVDEQPVAVLPCQVQFPLWQVQAEPMQGQFGPGHAPPAELPQPAASTRSSSAR